MPKETPHPMPPSMRDTVNLRLGDREMSMLDSNARFIVRQLVAEAYAVGFRDGRLDEHFAASVDREVARNQPGGSER